MSLSQLVNTFKSQAAANNGNITINAATFTESGLTPPEGLDELLQKGYALEAGKFLLLDTSNTTIPDPSGNTLTIVDTQSGVLNVEKANTSGTLVVTDDGSGNVQFTIDIALSDWTFETSWKYAKGGPFDGFPYTNPAFVFSTTDEAAFSWKNAQIALTKGQNFSSQIKLQGWLTAATEFLINWNSATQLALAGSLDPSQVDNEEIIYPDMNLKVAVPGRLISLSFMEVSNPSVGFQIKTNEIPVDPDEEISDEELALPPAERTELVAADEPETEKVQTPILYFQMDLSLGDDIEVEFTTALEKETKTFDISVSSSPDKPVTPLSLFNLMAGNNWFANIPPTLQQFLNSIAFKNFSTSLTLEGGLNIQSISTLVGSNGAWNLFSNFTIEEFDVYWLIIGPGSMNSQTLYFHALVNFFPDVFKGGFEVEFTSDLALSASFNGSVTFNDLVSGITGGAVTIPPDLFSVEFTRFGLDMDIPAKYYSFYCNANANIDFITNITVEDGLLEFTSTAPVNNTGKSVYTAHVGGTFGIGSLRLETDVNYNSAEDGGWDLKVAMPAGDKLNLGELMDQMFKMVGFELPTAFLPADLAITQFEASANIPSSAEKGSVYAVKSALAWNFIFPIINTPISLTADLGIEYNTKTKEYKGAVGGSILFKPFNAPFKIGYNFSANDQMLTMEWSGFIAKYEIKTGTDPSKTITFEIKNWSVGELISSFMQMLFDPQFELPAPWNLLNKLSLDGFKVIFNLDNHDVTVEYALPSSLDLVFIKIDGLKLSKTSKGVFISFTGSSPVPGIQDSSLFKPEGNDVKDMPSVPGAGNKYIDIRLLALGQHVALQNLGQYQTIKAVTKAMEDAFKEPEPGKLPVGPGSGNSLLSFDENSNWLIATDLGILNVGTSDNPIWTIELQAVFNDPNLYGLRIALAGDKAKVLAGLDFEIMYKKISDSVGLYQINLTLPTALRYLQFGAVNITLPSIGLQIYTNGDFLVDIGFPYNMDFSRSFTVQAIVPPGIPAMGSGGFYFGKLSSATTNKVPSTTYGLFNPVIVFGIGLQVGVGYSVNYGVLSAGFSLTLFGILEGVIATYHPYQGILPDGQKTDVEKSYYYMLKGTIGIIGRLYGSIDFGIISANVDITVKVYATATFEAYNKMPLAIVASVDVKVSAKINLGIFSIKISFSFTAEIRQDVTIGTDRTKDAPWNRQLGTAPESFTFQTSAKRMYANVQRVMNYDSFLMTEETEVAPTLDIYMVPQLTVAGPENNNLKDQKAQYATTLWIEAPDPTASATSAPTTSFGYLAQDFFRWLILNYSNEVSTGATRAQTDSTALSQVDLDALEAFLSNDATPLPIDPQKLLDFLKNTFSAVNVKTLSNPDQIPQGAVFPMFFDLELSVPDANVDINFADYNMATDEYLSKVKEWFAQLAVQVSEESENTNEAMMRKAAIEHSLSTFVFEDYFVMIGKQLIGYAGDALKNFTYPLSKGNGLGLIVNWANSITGNDGGHNTLTAQAVAKANQSHPLNSGLTITISGVMYTIATEDTFYSISHTYPLNPATVILQNQNVPNLLQAGQEIKYKDLTYTVQSGDTVAAVATGLGSGTTVSELANDSVFQRKTVLLANGIMTIAASKYTAQNEDTFASVASGTSNGISASDLLLQNQLMPGLFIAGQSFKYNDTTYTIVPGDTLTSIATNLSQTTGTTVSIQDLASDSAVQGMHIQPLGVLYIQPFTYTTKTFTEPSEADTLGAIAQKFSTTAEALGENYENQEVNNLFSDAPNYTSVNVPGLTYLDLDSILAYFNANKSYTNLSGMVSRYQLHGMRLPTNLPGLTLSPNSPCTGDDCALYMLTGQQFALPANVEKDFEINLVNKTLDWLQFNGQVPSGDPKEATLTIKLTDEDITQINTVLSYAQTTGLIPDIRQLKPVVPYDLLPVQYSFRSVRQWTSSGKIVLPYGSQGNQESTSPLIWEFPTGMLQQIALKKKNGSAFDIQIGTYNSSKGIMDYRFASNYAWSTLLEIDIKRLADDDASGTKAFTYELLGADGAGTQVLERLLQALNPNSPSNNTETISDLQLLYAGGDGLVSIGNANMRTYIVQSNLSTETNPPPAAMLEAMARMAEPDQNGVMNTLFDFIKYMWECSITRSGGYFLLYNEVEGNVGFPDTIFDKAGNATIQLLVTYTSAYNDVLTNFMNVGITGEKIDLDSSFVYAESKAQTGITYTTQSASETLASIAAQYNILLSELAILNATSVKWNPAAAPVTLTGLIYEVGLPSATPTNTSAAIASYFGVDKTTLENLNPGVSDWNDIPFWQLLLIPPVTYTIRENDTFQSVANYFFTDVDTLAFELRKAPLFAKGTSFSIRDQVVYKASTVSQGNAGFMLDRTEPAEVDKPSVSGYADSYLNNLYNLLNYQVVGNRFFLESIVGLPAGPSDSKDQDQLLGKTEAESGEEWHYKQVIPVAKYAKDNPKMSYSSGLPGKEDNPYRGIGHTVQVHFDWVDYYGNITVTPFSDPALSPASPLNNLPVNVGYSDELLGISQWPSMTVDYYFNNDQDSHPELALKFVFNTDRYKNEDGSQCVNDTNDYANMPDWQRNALHDLSIYTTIYYQLTQLDPDTGDNTVTITLGTSLLPGKDGPITAAQFTALTTLVGDIYKYLYAVAHCQTAPAAPTMAPITREVQVADIETASIFELTVNLNMTRDLKFVNDDFKDSPSVTQAFTAVQPDTLLPGDENGTPADPNQQNHALSKFALKFEETFVSDGNYLLKIASGVKDATAASSSQNHTIYVVRMGYQKSQGLYWKLKPTTNWFYAPTPISTSLKSKNGVPICTYTTGQGLNCDNPQLAHFTGIDLDIWGKQCLAAIDQFLSADLSVPAFLVDQLKAGEETAWLQQMGISADSFLEAMTNAKSSLSETLSGTVTHILEDPATLPETTANAREKFKQQLLIELSNMYTINAVVQMEVDTASGIAQDEENQFEPRLYGVPTITNETVEQTKLYSVSNAKIPLNFESADKPSDLTFVFSTKDAREFTSVPLNMEFIVSHIEYKIKQDMPYTKGYQASEWLSFIIPETQAVTIEPNIDQSVLKQDMGLVDIPVVLRNYPTPPTLNKQSGLAVSTEGESTKEKLAKASEWNFTYLYTEDQAAQDQIFNDVEFNSLPAATPEAMFRVSQRNLFNDMAQMITVLPSVSSDLQKYLSAITPGTDASDPNVTNAYFAMQAMVQLSTYLAEAWQGYLPSSASFKTLQNIERAYDFKVLQKEDPHFTTECPCMEGNTKTCPRLVVTIVPPDKLSEEDKKLFMQGRTVNEAKIPNPPVVEIKGYKYETATDENGTEIPGSYWYYSENTEKEKEYLGYLCSFDIPDRTIALNELNVLQFQYAWAGIAVIRNEGLIEGNPTNTDFIYRTPLVRFSNKLIPLLNNDTVIDIAKLENESGENLPLSQHLANFLSTLFSLDKLDAQTIKISASWNYYLQENYTAKDGLPAIELPVLLYTPFSFQIPADYTLPNGGCPTEITPTTPFVCQFAGALQAWFQQMNPVTTGAYFQFEIAIFSSLDETKQPILTLNGIELPYGNITDL